MPTFWEVLADEKTSQALKAYAIKCNISAWKEKFTAKTLEPVYEAAILSTIGDRSCVSKLLNGYQRPERIDLFAIPEFDCPNKPSDLSYAAMLAERRQRQMKMQKLEEKPDVSSTSVAISQTNDTMDLSVGSSEASIPFFDKIESKYAEEVQTANDSKMFLSNTPVAAKRTTLKSSTPLTSKRTTHNKSIGSIKDSPLARAFQKCKSLNESKQERKKKRKITTVTEALAFLGLRDVLDIFVDPVESSDADVSEKKVKLPSALDTSYRSSDQQTLSDKRADAPTRVTQEYTVSQILKIVNLSPKSASGDKSEINNSSTPNKSRGKEIFVGTIDDIFGSYDSIDKPLSNGKECTRAVDDEEEDVIASSQPVISEIKLPSKYLCNNENKIAPPPPSAHPELDNDDDMFASFAKKDSPIPTSPVPHLNTSKSLPSLTRFHEPPSVRATINASFKSPSPNNSTVKTVDRSPSVFSRKINLSKLKALSLKSNSERMPSNSLQSKSPLFLSCRSLDVKYSQRNDERESDHSDNGSQVGEFVFHYFHIFIVW